MKPNPQITTGPMPASSKLHVPGTLHDIRVPMRRIALTGEDPLTVYDSSGPYTDANARIDSPGRVACGARGVADGQGRCRTLSSGVR